MQETSALFDQILNSGYYETEVRVVVNGETFAQDKLMDVSISRGLFNGDNLAIGSACIGSCSITLFSGDMTGKELSDTIPRGASINIFSRIIDASGLKSEWLSQGIFFVDQRDYTSWTGRLVLNGIDAMALADGDFTTNDMSWPKTDIATVRLIANQMGVVLAADVPTIINQSYSITNPITTYTLREVLGFIAAMYCGNWIINKDGELQLLTVDGLPTETNYLVTNTGSPITFGGVRILVQG